MKICPVCEKEFDKKTKYCSQKCQRKVFGLSQKGKKWSNEKKQALSNKLKTINGSEEVVKKRKQTCQERYGGNAPASSKEIRSKISATCLEKYGVENAMQSEEVKQIAKKTMEERYGGFTFQSKDLSNKVIATNLERYGSKNPFGSEVIKDKIRQTNLERYGVLNPMQCEEIRDKAGQTNLERYGVLNPMQSFIIRRKSLSKDRNLTEDEIDTFFHQINSQEWWDEQTGFCEAKNCLLSNLTPSQIYNYAHRFRPDWEFNGGISSHHQRIIDLLNENHIEHQVNTRSVISPLELDIYVPTKNLAIEVNRSLLAL